MDAQNPHGDGDGAAPSTGGGDQSAEKKTRDSMTSSTAQQLDGYGTQVLVCSVHKH